MKSTADYLWGERARFVYLFLTAVVLLFTLLGARDIWTQEHRWADIVSGMFYRGDFFHPYLNDVNYYDKPLLSYWLIAGIAYITGHLSAWTLRLPSALAGLLAVWSIYRLGTLIKNKSLGLLAGWMLLTCFYFLFWARTSSADMLNMAGSLFAVCWFIEKKQSPNFVNYAVFFLILAVTSLCKGLVGAIVPLIAVFADMMCHREWKKYFRLSLLLALIPAAIVYVLPFWASAHVGGDSYQQNGLYLVYRENILRYFQPFDHKDPVYSYLIFLPIYLLPWTLFFIPMLLSLKSRWQQMELNAKWIVWVVLLLFLFFTLSGSRRNYYILPVLPFAVLMTAEWILAQKSQWYLWAGKIALGFMLILFIGVDLFQSFYYMGGGAQSFAKELRADLSQVKPWNTWDFVMLDPESKIRFYMQLPPQIKNYSIQGEHRNQQFAENLLQAWPMLKNPSDKTVYITRKTYEAELKTLLKHYRVVEAPPSFGERILGITNSNATIAFVPVTS